MPHRTVNAEFQTPRRQAMFELDVAMPRKCSSKAALVIGEGLTVAARLADGLQKYSQLRQVLLDEQAASMATSQRFRVVN